MYVYLYLFTNIYYNNKLEQVFLLYTSQQKINTGP